MVAVTGEPIFNGGFGGGIGVSGQDGFGRYGGDGGESVNAGTLSLDGVFGSLFFGTTTVDDDFIETMLSPGRTISCTKGVYYRDQGLCVVMWVQLSSYNQMEQR